MSGAVDQRQGAFSFVDCREQEVTSQDVHGAFNEHGIGKYTVELLLARQGHLKNPFGPDDALGDVGEALPDLLGHALSLTALLLQLLVDQLDGVRSLVDTGLEQMNMTAQLFLQLEFGRYILWSIRLQSDWALTKIKSIRLGPDPSDSNRPLSAKLDVNFSLDRSSLPSSPITDFFNREKEEESTLVLKSPAIQ